MHRTWAWRAALGAEADKSQHPETLSKCAHAEAEQHDGSAGQGARGKLNESVSHPKTSNMYAHADAEDMDMAGGAAAVPDEVRRGKLNELLGVPMPGLEGTGGTEAEGAGGTDPEHPVDPAQVQTGCLTYSYSGMWLTSAVSACCDAVSLPCQPPVTTPWQEPIGSFWEVAAYFCELVAL